MRTILFGAFDRHNFGDLLFPHIVAALLPERELLFAGLLERDLSPYGGHPVRALARLAVELQDQPVDLIHVGGELLTCEAWQAAVMLLPEKEARRAIARLEDCPQERSPWARSVLGSAALAPYLIHRQLFPKAHRVICNGLGGVDLARCAPGMRSEVIARLAEADQVSVRDGQTQMQLRAAGITASLIPDSAAMLAELFGARIAQHAGSGEPARIRHAFPQGYIAVQFSADFGDEAMLDTIANQLDQLASDSGHGICLFRAGAAPWHDELSCYQRLAVRMRTARTEIFTALDVWDICDLIARSRGYCGSSLHGRIVATAFALPRLNLLHPAQAHRPTKQTAYAATWEAPGLPACVGMQDIAQGMGQALAADPLLLQRHAQGLADHYRKAFADLMDDRT